MKKIRYGVIGINGIGELHCRFVRANMQTELTSLVDRDQESVEQKAKEFGVKSFTDYRQMIEAGVVDAVSIATPHFLHAVIGLDCLKAGIHVFMEKPFACRVSEADEMIRVARENGLKICVGHQYRLHRTSKTMKHLVDSDTLGKIIRVLWTWGVFRPGKYFSRDIWRSTWEHAGGGVLMTHAIHDLDLLCWLFGRPVSVNAMLGNQLHDIAGEDIACANILFENSVAVSFQATLNQPEAYSVRQIAGDRGIMVIQDLKSTTFDHKDRIQVGHYQSDLRQACATLPGKMDQPAISWDTVRPIGDPPAWKKLLEKAGLMKIKRIHGLNFLLDDFIEAIVEDREPLVNGTSALAPLELVNAMILSSVRGKTVDLPLDREEYDTLFAELCEGRAEIPKYRNGIF